MSQSPEQAVSVSQSYDTQSAFETNLNRLNVMLDDGLSWSGHEKNCVFLNQGGDRFATISATSGIDFGDDGRAHGLVDWDHDGDLDVWTSNRTAPQVRFLRNDYPTDNHFVALRLEGNGTTTNRNAIGARAELRLAGEGPNRLRIRSLRAGEGYLGQSSKWLHFGLAEGEQIESLTIHWPGSEQEVYAGVQPDGFYELRQGSGVAEPWEPPSRTVGLAAEAAELPEESAQAAVRLASRFPLPEMRYLDNEQRLMPLLPPKGQARLVNIWSPTCRPCAAELSEFTARAADLRDAGLEVLAITTSGIGGDESTLEQSAAFLESLDFPFASGQGTEELLSQLHAMQNFPFTLHTQLAQPTSLLIDRQGRLAGIYRGRVPVDRLLEDMAVLDLEDEARWQVSTALPGTWFGVPDNTAPFDMATNLVSSGDPNEAIRYVESNLELLESDPQFPDLLTGIGVYLMKDGRSDEAIRYFRRALNLKPELGGTRGFLAFAMSTQGQLDEAIVEYRQAIADRPESADLRAMLAGALDAKARLAQSQGRPEEFEQFTEQSLALLAEATELEPRNSRVREQRITMLTRLDREEATLDDWQALLRFDPRGPEVHLNLVKLLQKYGRNDEAFAELEDAAILYPQNAAVLKSYAWELATSPNAEHRDGKAALRQAQRALELANRRDCYYLDVLAAAQAEAGQFEDAAATAREAKEKAELQLDRATATALAERIALYEQRQPYHQPAAGAETTETAAPGSNP